MNIYLLTLYMFLLTFAIGFIVAFIIKISVRGVEFSQTIRDEKYHQEMRRLRSIKRIRHIKNTSILGKIEEASNNKMLNYYYSNYIRKRDNVTSNTANEIAEHQIEEASNSKLLNYYYGNRKRDNLTSNDTNEIIEH